jgi:hypothetical protein
MPLDVASGVLLGSPLALQKRGAVPGLANAPHSIEQSYQQGERLVGDEEKGVMDASDDALVTLETFWPPACQSLHLERP